MPKTHLFVVMGVSGSGKSTVGKLLADSLDIPFFDGDDFHSQENREKMASGAPLNDEDRFEWLLTLNKLLYSNRKQGAVVACSALKKKYRTLLSQGIQEQLDFIYLKGSYKEIKLRMEQRKGHFMPLALLKSQFLDLETPESAIIVPISTLPKDIVHQILKILKPN